MVIILLPGDQLGKEDYSLLVSSAACHGQLPHLLNESEVIWSRKYLSVTSDGWEIAIYCLLGWIQLMGMSGKEAVI